MNVDLIVNDTQFTERVNNNNGTAAAAAAAASATGGGRWSQWQNVCALIIRLVGKRLSNAMNGSLLFVKLMI